MGDISRPYVAPRRVTLIGHDHFHQPHMTDMQRERAEPVLQPVENPTVLGCDMPPWCAGVIAGAALCIPALFFAGAFS